MNTSYNDTSNEVSIELVNKDGNPLIERTITLPKATTLKDGLMAKEDKIKIDAIANGSGGGDVASLIADLQNGTIIVDKATKDNGGSPLVQTYATSMDTSYDDENNRISIILKKQRRWFVG